MADNEEEDKEEEEEEEEEGRWFNTSVKPSRLTKLIGTGKEELLTRANMKPTVLVVWLFKAVETVPFSG